MAALEKPRVRVKAGQIGDGFQNLVANIGTARDKASAGTWFHNSTSLQEIDALYRGTWLGKKIIDIPVGDMTREWRVFRTDDEAVKRIEAEEKRLQLRAKVARAMRWARLYGGAVLVLSDGAEDPSQPLDASRIAKGGLKFVHPLTRFQIGYFDIDLDPLSPSYGEPPMWQVAGATGRMANVHHTRVIKFIGAERPPTMGMIDPWGDSAFDAIREAIMRSDTAAAAMTSLLTEAKIDILTIPDLQAHLQTPDGEERLMRRFNLAALLKGINGMMLMGAGEEHSQKTITFTGLPEVHARLLQEVSGAADIPMTRLLGQSPGGLQSTGESDLRNYYDAISAKQEETLRPALERIDAALIPSALGSAPADLWFEFGELWQLSEKDQADILGKTASALKTLADAAIMPDAALSKSAVALLDGEGMLPGIADAVKEFGGYEEGDREGEDDGDTGAEPSV
jgi:phage-related protein (TIGR01555 family)